MFRRSSLIGAGVVFGVVVALTVPSLAHHNPEFDRLRKRVTNLTARVQEAETSNTVLQERLDALEPEVAVVAEESEISTSSSTPLLASSATTKRS